MPVNGAAPAGARELVLRPQWALSWQDVRDVWDRRELLWILALRDVRVRYTQAVLGVAWAVLQPLLQMVLFTLLFHYVVGIPSGPGAPYPLFCMAGLLVWTLFTNGLGRASESLVSGAGMVTKVYFPRAVLPLAAVTSAAVDFLVALALLPPLLLYFGHPWRLGLLATILPAAVAFLCAAGLGFFTSALNLRFRDVRHMLPFLTQLLVYVTPVFYPSSLLPERWRPLLYLNPMAAVVETFRALALGLPVPWLPFAVSAATAVALVALGFVWFRRQERLFADRV
jgi:lipopolysaccharide transport system permease protein